MSEDGKDAGLVAMITSILGGNKRADVVTPPPLAEAPPTAPTNGFEAVEPSNTDAAAPAVETVAADTQVEAPPKIVTTRDGKQLLPAEAIADLVLGELRKMENFPATGASVTVYGYKHWNAMITFAPFSTTFQNATRFRQAMPDIVFKLRRFVELEI
ncbi:hypothetical protein IVA87_04900 [Bradyrhizobium sp. 147]|uniref:hypothetical protein n=1 Tax=unclassified Bradyrhizobium TaxID=2631580 RepID=UPI001FF8394B|nr:MULTISPECIES: hypothetical protein [unclassified Bradyrhizobium]MCK1547051.1 hypothetical protein [Bradyrhizobium sp. 179]MCK1627117.1 hypothetical protein [Bradyrhizobium sp. 160]MCK1678822.1 hypothetical protein [Bradyrhizobium sp. 147]